MTTNVTPIESHTATPIPTAATVDATGVAAVVHRALDVADRAHARAAGVLHGARHRVLTRVERSLARAEQATARALARARQTVLKADTASADAVNRAQGAVGHVIERARESTLVARARTKRERATA